jgi:hypothetical protein
VIEGFRIDVTAEEVVRHLDERIRHHNDRAKEFEARAQRVGNDSRVDDEDEQLALCWPGYVHDLERRAARHRRRELFLIFARDHVVASDIYRLTEKDLRALEWMPMEDSLSADPA